MSLNQSSRDNPGDLASHAGEVRQAGEEMETGGRAEMTDLAEALAGADGQAVAATLIARFETAQTRLGAEMDRGTAPARFAAISAVRRGLHHAGQVLHAAAGSNAGPDARSHGDACR